MKPKIADVHPDLQASAKKIPTIAFNSMSLRVIRLLMKLQRGAKAPDDVAIENIRIPNPDAKNPKGKLRLRIYRPKSGTGLRPGLVWLHGGGYIIGKPEMADASCIQYVRELGIVIASVDYRLAPDYPFPTPLEDSYRALTWVNSHAGKLGIDAKRLAIGGESSGSGLAAALAQYAYDRHEVKIGFQLLVYPMLDDRTCVRTDNARQGYLAWTQKSNWFGWEAYLGKKPGAAEVPAYSVPSRRVDLTGLPRAWIGVGTLDLFHDEDVAYAERLKACGVACDLYVVPGGFHGFDLDAPEAPVVQAFRKAQIAALKQAFFS